MKISNYDSYPFPIRKLSIIWISNFIKSPTCNNYILGTRESIALKNDRSIDCLLISIGRAKKEMLISQRIRIGLYFLSHSLSHFSCFFFVFHNFFVTVYITPCR